MKKRWRDCEIIAKHLGLTKSQVFHNLYEDILAGGMLEFALEGMMEGVKELDSYRKLVKKFEIVETPGEQISIAMWFIRKLGSPQQAAKALKAATLAIKELGKNEGSKLPNEKTLDAGNNS